MSPANTLYDVLGLAPTASAEEIEAANGARRNALHGDADALSLLRVAYDTLRDPARRAAYDRKLARQEAAAGAAAAVPAVRPASRSGWRLRAALLLAVAVAVGTAFLLQPLPPSPAPALAAGVPVPATAGVPPAADEAADSDTDADGAADEPDAAGEAPPEPAPPPAAPVAAPAAALPAVREAVVPKRPPKQPGFDARYVAWSVYTIRQRNKTGSGVLIAPDRILTNCHVLAGGASNGLIVVHGLTGRVTTVEKYARLDGEDACLLYAPGVGDESIAWGNSAALRPGDTVHAMGHPGGSALVNWSEGSVHVRTEHGGQFFILSDNYCRPGSSGGPLLDAEGRLVGIVTAVQRYRARGGEPPRFGACISVTEATARALLAKPLFPIALAPAQYFTK